MELNSNCNNNDMSKYGNIMTYYNNYPMYAIIPGTNPSIPEKEKENKESIQKQALLNMQKFICTYGAPVQPNITINPLPAYMSRPPD